MIQNHIQSCNEATGPDHLKQDQINQISNLYAKANISHKVLTSLLGLGETITGSHFFPQEVVAISLAQMHYSHCSKCMCAKIGVAKFFGFSEEEILQIRNNKIADPKLSTLIGLVHELKETDYKPHKEKLKQFYKAGYSKNQLCDLIGLVSLSQCENEEGCLPPECQKIINAA